MSVWQWWRASLPTCHISKHSKQHKEVGIRSIDQTYMDDGRVRNIHHRHRSQANQMTRQQQRGSYQKTILPMVLFFCTAGKRPKAISGIWIIWSRNRYNLGIHGRLDLASSGIIKKEHMTCLIFWVTTPMTSSCANALSKNVANVAEPLEKFNEEMVEA